MSKRMKSSGRALASVLLVAGTAGAAPPPGAPVIASFDLAKPFRARSAWRLTASQRPAIDDEFGGTGDKVPGAIRLCLQKRADDPCDPALQGAATDDGLFTEPQYLKAARLVRPRGGSNPPVLLVQTASLHSGDGDQLVWTRALAYRRDADRFVSIYARSTGRNNNQDTRYVDAGPLKGDMISVEPTQDAPFGFWVSVNALTPAYVYKPVLRYRSATLYNDGNPLAVIDSEMPNIQQRLGLWRPGAPLPPPAGRCPKPHLIRMELWCG